jgi:hypothetical protein
MIVVDSLFENQWNIFTVNVDGSGETQLTFDGDNTCPKWQRKPALTAETTLLATTLVVATTETETENLVQTLPGIAEPYSPPWDFMLAIVAVVVLILLAIVAIKRLRHGPIHIPMRGRRSLFCSSCGQEQVNPTGAVTAKVIVEPTSASIVKGVV